MAAEPHKGPAFQRALRKQVTADLRKKDRAKLVELREKIRRAKDTKRDSLRAVTVACRVARVTAKEAAKAAREQLRRDIEQARREMRGQCHANRDRERELGRTMVDATRTELHEARSEMRARHRAEGARRLERLTKREARGESDDEVRNNLPRELLVVWKRVKASIHGSARRTRTEAFLDWVHDNSAAVERIRNEAAERDLEDLIRQERELDREIRRGERYRRSTPELMHHAGGTPF